MPEAVFTDHGGQIFATELARGPWDPNAQHGGAAAALLMRAFESLPAAEGLQIARVTYEFLRPVPLGELTLETAVTRGGKRVQLLEGALRSPDGTEVVRARCLQVSRARSGAAPQPAGRPPQPQGGGRRSDQLPPFSPMFAPDAIELRFVDGSFHGRGPATAWFRMRVPLVAGEALSPLQRLAVAGDFGNGISSPLRWDEYVFINPDLTLYIEREPVGEWIALQSVTWIPEGGIGVSDSVLWDEHGRVGRAQQALLIARR